MNNDTLPCGDFSGFCRHVRPEVFKALSDPTRLAILARVAGADGPLTVSQASHCCGIHFSGVSRHLKALKEAGLLSVEKRGRDVAYRPNLGALAAGLRALADAIDACPARSGGGTGSPGGSGGRCCATEAGGKYGK
ncbi:ArsR/SmtB family transcription factor [Solidesulfovibrio carbinolicus]|uniref:ArsR family transcriptional regulator n=1 Tax=Solidesulfovibrio carbinolicus TaxID=296842 RepID=A0A4P6HR57_9BACT|nr:metalloregulator ArsR/SmtB family transcription factor [Solidesulfovibrio carbinolicus]QAZ69224.1 ArsR family transcriptional regulator [Solidesulfovibrio carbinolicus]